MEGFPTANELKSMPTKSDEIIEQMLTAMVSYVKKRILQEGVPVTIYYYQLVGQAIEGSGSDGLVHSFFNFGFAILASTSELNSASSLITNKESNPGRAFIKLVEFLKEKGYTVICDDTKRSLRIE
jgi:hypothetical protein